MPRPGSVPPTLADEHDDHPDRRRRRLVANRAFGALKAQHSAERTRVEAAADWLNDLAASTPFLVGHAVGFAGWILWNLGWLGLSPFDPFPFGLLTMIVSLEAIFLSIFVLMAQQRESAIAELREELALQVNLRIEEEATKALQLVAGLYTRLGHRVAEDPELTDMMQPLDVVGLERALALQIAETAAARRSGAADAAGGLSAAGGATGMASPITPSAQTAARDVMQPRPADAPGPADVENGAGDAPTPLSEP